VRYSLIKPEWLVAAVLVVSTTAATLLTIRWLAPQLLGIPIDMQLVRSSETIPPFFDGVFRDKDYASDELLLKDPVTNVRFKPSLDDKGGTGPHDILGFRNRGISNRPDVIVIGDSQTYGIGEHIDNTWPSQLNRQLDESGVTVYSIAVGGWAATQYLHMANVAMKLRPRTLVVAFYSGNDALESFRSAYGNNRWSSLRTDDALDKSDAPAIGNMLDADGAWSVSFQHVGGMIFTPVGRLNANSDHPAVRAGYAIMAETARRIAGLVSSHDVEVVFTVIPTRELVYRQRVEAEGLSPPESYRQLVAMESRYIDLLAETIQSIPGGRYIDLVTALQSAALGDASLYPRKWDGHPGAAGYQAIATALAPAVSQSLGR
jgi:lysophospholipase L1-like esterase